MSKDKDSDILSIEIKDKVNENKANENKAKYDYSIAYDEEVLKELKKSCKKHARLMKLLPEE